MSHSNTISTDESQSHPIPHVGRPAHNFPGSQYVLPADEKESTRLNLQNTILTKVFDGKKLFVPLEGRPAYFVLDCGTGTGIWLLEVASSFSPSAILHGIDIEGRLFPQSRPTNVSFSINSVTNLPLEWGSKFDIVHQRLLMAALTRPQWSAALGNMYRVLRPGGWIQLLECENVEGGVASEKYCDMLRELYRRRDLVVRIFEEIPKLLEEAGFLDVKIERSSCPLGKWAGQLGVDGRTNMMGAFRAMKIPILRMGGFGMVHSEEEADRLLDDVEKEWDTIEGMALGYCVFVARKPAASSK